MTSKNYLDNARFEELIKLYLEGNKSVEPELFLMFDLLIDKILHTFRFNVDDNDAKQECYLNIIRILKNFNHENGTAFNYFTQCIINTLRGIFTKNKKYSDKISEYISVIGRDLETLL